MDMLVQGTWQTDVGSRTDSDGAFEREETVFRDWIQDAPDAKFQPEPDRYHLYIARSCPWAHGAALVRTLTGLEDTISMDVADHIRADQGWQFSPEKTDCTPDTATGNRYLRDVYVQADPEFTGRVTVPTLWDKKRETIVNNESIEIMRMLNAAFTDYKSKSVELYPEGYRTEIDRIIDDIYDTINNGVYRAGYSQSQESYETAVNELFAAIDKYDAHLGSKRYLAGDRLTLADVRLLPTLIRFDTVYHYLFKCNIRTLRDYPNLWNYTRELYQLPGVQETVNWEHIKSNYYYCKTHINPNRIIPVGPSLDFEADHGRDRLPGGPPAPLAT